MTSDLASTLTDEGRIKALLVAAVAAVGAYILHCWRQGKELPPGPTGLPIVGRIPWIDAKHMHLSMQRECRKYGDICSFYIGSKLFIVVNSYELLKEMLDDPKFAGRPQLSLLERVTRGCGIIFTEGDRWSQHRRLSLKTLRDFGFARAHTVDMVNDQLDVIFQAFDEAADSSQQVAVLDWFLLASNTIITEMTLGHRFSNNDPLLVKVNALMKKMVETSFTQAASIVFPAIERIIAMLPAESVDSDAEFLHDFIRNEINKRQKIIDQGAQPTCLCDVYIQEKQKAEKAGDLETFKEFQLIRVCFEFYFAGTDTTARSVEWLLLYMAFYPDVQDRVELEIDDIIGRSRRPKMQDKMNLHYTCAVIDETYRKVSLAPTGLFHRAIVETTFHGFRIPSDAFIIPFLYGVHHRADYWEKPNDFYPEHFLDDKGHYRSSPYLIPFLIGRRACIGESLARMEIFLFFTAILQRYRVRPSAESLARKEEILLGQLGTLQIPGEYKLQISRR